ncbi:hypothetical protein GLYMA_07G160950v4 [Glycine max]|nr:hypothetical protein GLYMA_07G160950v4 [Glycine max]KAH1087110.1 hypothetical protein GYH30_018581 [Glycine max]
MNLLVLLLSIISFVKSMHRHHFRNENRKMIHQLVDKESLKLIRKIIYLQFSLNPELHFLAQITLEALKGSQQKNKLNVAARREYCIG